MKRNSLPQDPTFFLMRQLQLCLSYFLVITWCTRGVYEVFLRRTGVVMASDTKLLLLTKVKPIIMITINKIIVQ